MPQAPPYGELVLGKRRWTYGQGSRSLLTQREGVRMSLVKRLAVAVGSLLALVLAGGAHFKF